MTDYGMSELEDNEILKRMRSGDTGALGILYMRYAPAVSNFAYRFIRVREDADDITHNVFCALWEARERLDNVESLKSYLFQMTKNAIFKEFRHRQVVSEYTAEKETSADDVFIDGEKAVTTQDLLEMINLYLSNLPEPQRRAFQMSRYENKTYAEIAVELGVSPKTVQYYISRVLAELRKLTEVMLIFTTFDSL